MDEKRLYNSTGNIAFEGIVICADKDGENLPATRKSGGRHGHGLKTSPAV